jgi:hypothetical protein
MSDPKTQGSEVAGAVHLENVGRRYPSGSGSKVAGAAASLCAKDSVTGGSPLCGRTYCRRRWCGPSGPSCLGMGARAARLLAGDQVGAGSERAGEQSQ